MITNLCANPSCQHRRGEHWFGKDCRAFEGCQCQLYLSDLPIGIDKLIDRELEVAWIESHRELVSGDFRFSTLGSQAMVAYTVNNSRLYQATPRGIPKEFSYLNPALQGALEIASLILLNESKE